MWRGAYICVEGACVCVYVEEGDIYLCGVGHIFVWRGHVFVCMLRRETYICVEGGMCLCVC